MNYELQIMDLPLGFIHSETFDCFYCLNNKRLFLEV